MNTTYPGQSGPGKRLIWTDDLERETSAGSGSWVPAGTHSGIATTVRQVNAGDPYIPVDPDGTVELIQYEATYRLLDVPAIGQHAGQITARGVILFRIGQHGSNTPIDPVTFAITGGTGFYSLARGEGSQSPQTTGGDLRILNIDIP